VAIISQKDEEILLSYLAFGVGGSQNNEEKKSV
jgi:hypothetical protein